MNDEPRSAKTAEEIRLRLMEIIQRRSEPDVAHGLEDDLHQDTLKAIAAGAPNARELAAEALKSMEIEFPRWFN